MPRRSYRKSRPSRLGLLLVILAIAGVLYFIWRYPSTASQLASDLLEQPTIIVQLPGAATSPAGQAQPTATRQPRPRPTTAPAPPNAPVAPTSQPILATSTYQLFFTTPRYPDRPEYHRGGLDTQLVEFLNSAGQTIDIAVYDFDLENVAEALAQAAGRGVRVRMVTDTDTLTNPNQRIQRAFEIVKRANIPIVDDQRPAIMHHKFVVVDGQAIWTGSWNFTDGDTYRLNNNAIRIASPDLAQNYTLEFEKMFVDRKFGPAKSSSLGDPVLQVGDTRVENYFAPEGKVADRIIARLQLAKQSIHFMAFTFTDDPIGKALRDLANAGVQVSGVFEKTGSETQFSEYGKLRRAKIDVLQDGNPYVMHHKVFIIDGSTVIFGSFNFSNNANTENDENLLIIDDQRLAQAFEAEFQRVRNQALNPPK